MQQNPHGQIQLYMKYVKVFYSWASAYLMSFNELIYIRLLEECGVAYHIMMNLTALSQVVYVTSAHANILGELFCGEPYLFDRLYRYFLSWHRLNHHKTHQGYIHLSREASYLCFANCDRLLLGFESNLKPVTPKGIPLISFYHLRLYPMSIRLL